MSSRSHYQYIMKMTMNDVKRMTTNDKIFKDVIILEQTHNKQYRVFFQALNNPVGAFYTELIFLLTEI